MYSVDVLRLDASKSSLDHLSSRMTFSRKAGGGDNESSRRADFDDDYSVQVQNPSQHPGTMSSSWPYPFPIPSVSARVSVVIDDKNYALYHAGHHISQGSEEEYNRRRHVCDICLMRFKRPSGLRTHLNTHTGATRESRTLDVFNANANAI